MSREIKFRAWDGERFYAFENHAYYLIYNDITGWYVIPNVVNKAHLTRIEVQLQQFTGLHDKNGVEIYEGDIVEGQDIFGVIEWDGWRASYSIELAGIYSSHLEAYDDGKRGHFARVYVVGNIHENPELLA